MNVKSTEMTNGDDEFLTAFETGSLPFKKWSHSAHVRIAFLFLSRLRLEDAIDRMRLGIKAYNAVHRIEDGPERGYHETTTQAFMRLIHHSIQARSAFSDSDEFCKENPELLDRRVLLCYYTRDRLMAADAKSGFVEPDIAPLDRIGLAFPEFGRRFDDVVYTLRPGSYGVISDDAGRVALVITPQGAFLPGGGQEPGESAITALHREAQEECGLALQVGRPIGTADEFVFAEEECAHFCKRCTFYSAIAVASGPSAEPDHRLIWLTPEQAVQELAHGSQRWAVRQFMVKSSTFAASM